MLKLAAKLFSVILAVLPVLPTINPPNVVPPVLNLRSVLVVTALVKFVAVGSMAKVPAPLNTACDTITFG